MHYQLDIMAIGDKKCGDAFLMRFGDLESGDPERQTVILLDGGYPSNGREIVDYAIEHYDARRIDLAISSHSDIDHIGGLPGVIEFFPVDNLWMHLPWEHSGEILAGRQEDFSVASLTKKLRKSLQRSSDLAAAADAAGIAPVEPFLGMRYKSPYVSITVLGPSLVYYEDLLAQMMDLSVRKVAAATQDNTLLQELMKGMQQRKQPGRNVLESHGVETLTDNGDAGPSNNTSTVLLFELTNGEKFLFTGDAGIQALEPAFEAYVALGHKPGELGLFQVPHHGSRKNLGPTILDKFLGPKTLDPDLTRGIAIVSVARDCQQDGHPKAVATNAVKRRGYPVIATAGNTFKIGFPRLGWDGRISPLPLYALVEADD